MDHILSPDNALTYILGGRGKCTLVGTSTRYTYAFGLPKDKGTIFVRLLVAPDRYEYIGHIYKGELRWKKPHPALTALDWYLKACQAKSDKANKATFYHSGICCRCGRELTTPESITKGIGPICETK
jgi:hypothetical protein